MDDLPILYEFEQGIITAERPFDPTLKPGHINYYDLKEMIELDDVEVIVATLNEEIIGSAYVKIKKSLDYFRYDQYAYVGFMFVKPSYRGQRISAKILEGLKKWGLEKGLKELRLDVYSNNPSAIKSYSGFGFTKSLVNMRMEI